jgi:hypothetical protein
MTFGFMVSARARDALLLQRGTISVPFEKV